MDISLPSSSRRRLCFVTVAHEIIEVEKQRLWTVSRRVLDTAIFARGIVLLAEYVRQAWKKAEGSWLRAGRAAWKIRDIDFEDISLLPLCDHLCRWRIILRVSR